MSRHVCSGVVCLEVVVKVDEMTAVAGRRSPFIVCAEI